MNFCFLAGYALACPFCDVSGREGPNETCGCDSDARMAQGMNVVENLMLELNGRVGEMSLWRHRLEV